MRSTDQKRIAELSRVSQTTVSRVLNKSPLIVEEVRNRVMKVMDELDYHPDGIARSFVRNRTGNIGFILCARMISNPIYFRMFHSVDQALSQHNKKLLFSSADEFLAEKAKFPLILKEKLLDGVIVCGKVSAEFINIMKKRRIPTVLFGNSDIEGVDIIESDNKIGVLEAVSYLISLGHRRIGFMSGSFEYAYHRELLSAYKEDCQKAGIEYDEKLIQENAEENASVMLERLLSLSEPPTAIFAVNDMIAINAMEVLKEKGFEIPEDISIVGFHDIDIASYTSPRLTTVRIFADKMAEVTLERLIEIIENDDQEPVRKKVETKLIIRESCGYATQSARDSTKGQDDFTRKEVDLTGTPRT